MSWQAWNTGKIFICTFYYSSHWDKRTLHHEVMNGYISKYVHNTTHSLELHFYKFLLSILWPRDYLVMSEFTLALFEDSGWYKANYTALYNIKQNPLQWGKGKDWV